MNAVNTETLTSIEYALRCQLRDAGIEPNDIHVAEQVDLMFGHQVRRFAATFRLWGADSDTIVRHPDGWVQAVKERFLPAWLKKRFPVRYKVYTFKEIDPGFKYIVPKNPTHIWIKTSYALDGDE